MQCIPYTISMTIDNKEFLLIFIIYDVYLFIFIHNFKKCIQKDGAYNYILADFIYGL